MKDKSILAAVCLSINSDFIKGIPTIIASSEDELEKVSSELGKILQGKVFKLSNGIILIISSNS
ncbi:MAG: capping complex subunit for YIEGIA [Bacillota bacterium]